jgi:hypothetical protein
MAKTITSWQTGKSGNPGGRPAKHRALTEMLRIKSDDQVSVGGEVMSGKEALAKAVWQFVTTGEVWLQGKKLEADTSSEWLNAVKWLYTYMEPPKAGEADVEQEMTVRIERVQKPYLNPGAIQVFAKTYGQPKGSEGEYSTPPPGPLPVHGEGEEETMLEDGDEA